VASINGVIVVKGGRTILFDLFGQDQRIAHQDAGQSIKPRMALTRRLVEVSNIGTTPTSPSGAVTMTRAIVGTIALAA